MTQSRHVIDSLSTNYFVQFTIYRLYSNWKNQENPNCNKIIRLNIHTPNQ